MIPNERLLPSRTTFHNSHFSTADIFEDFRQLSIKEYELPPENFYSLPGLSLSAALKLTGVNLQLITEPDLYLWWESMIRG